MPMNSNDLNLICDLVRRRSGIELDSAKEYLVEARMLPLSRKLGMQSIEQLVTALRGSKPGLERDVVDAMTTNETSFFRDLTPFELLRKSVFPDLLSRRAMQKQLNIWCAASSTGQEPYTIALLLREHFPQLFMGQWQLNFIASDLSRDVLNKARAGKFSQLEVNRGLPATLLAKYFKKQGLTWELSESVRSMITFQEINLLEAWPSMPPLDLVFIRNVLIYFSNENKRRILQRIRLLMQPDAYLFLGVAETTMNLDEQLVRGQHEKSGCYQIKTSMKAAA